MKAYYYVIENAEVFGVTRLCREGEHGDVGEDFSPSNLFL
jgi:hypothetical protein